MRAHMLSVPFCVIDVSALSAERIHSSDAAGWPTTMRGKSHAIDRGRVAMFPGFVDHDEPPTAWTSPRWAFWRQNDTAKRTSGLTVYICVTCMRRNAVFPHELGLHILSKTQYTVKRLRIDVKRFHAPSKSTALRT